MSSFYANISNLQDATPVIRNVADVSSLTARIVVSVVAGVGLHQTVFRKGEWHLHAPQLFTLWLVSYPVLFALEYLFLEHHVLQSLSRAAVMFASTMLAMFGSMAMYRVYFHRLGKFPGPKLAATSKLWHSYQCLNGKNYLVLDDLRRQYGDYVRTGPNEVTIFNPEALIRLDGPGNKTTKAVWYDFLMPDIGVTTIRDKKFHDQRRRVWTQAFSSKTLPGYERQMIEHAKKLEVLVEQACEKGTSVPFSSYAYWFAFDVMGMFALSESFNMINSTQWHYAVSNLRRAMSILGPLSPVPWLAQIGFKYLKGYWLIKDWHSMTSWCRTRMEQRIKNNDGSMNIASFLIDDAVERDSLDTDHHLLAGEAIVAIVAGSDTVAPTMVFLFYELAKHPEQAEKLFEELQGVDLENLHGLESLKHLNALIDETMRLHPAVPTGGYRDTPAEGMKIGDQFIPGNITIVAPRYSIFRSTSCYEQPNDFIPERWYSRPELVKDDRSFKPFAQGRYTCVGKALALSELRYVTALLVSKYRFKLAPGAANLTRVEDDLRDQFTAAPGQLDLIFEAR